MRGCFPRFDILLHIVTEATEGRALGISKNACEENNEKQKKKAKGRLLFPL
jgi:hypothetical protein